MSELKELALDFSVCVCLYHRICQEAIFMPVIWHLGLGGTVYLYVCLKWDFSFPKWSWSSFVQTQWRKEKLG